MDLTHAWVTMALYSMYCIVNSLILLFNVNVCLQFSYSFNLEMGTRGFLVLVYLYFSICTGYFEDRILDFRGRCTYKGPDEYVYTVKHTHCFKESNNNNNFVCWCLTRVCLSLCLCLTTYGQFHHDPPRGTCA